VPARNVLTTQPQRLLNMMWCSLDEDFQQYSQEEEYVGEQVEYCCDQDYGSQEYQEGLQYAEQAYAGDQTYEMVEGEVYAEEGYATNEQSSLYPVPDDGNIMYQDHTAEVSVSLSCTCLRL